MACPLPTSDREDGDGGYKIEDSGASIFYLLSSIFHSRLSPAVVVASALPHDDTPDVKVIADQMAVGVVHPRPPVVVWVVQPDA
jgi:hypothetical protein